MAISMTYMYDKVSTLSVLDYMPYALVMQFVQTVRQNSLYMVEGTEQYDKQFWKSYVGDIQTHTRNTNVYTQNKCIIT